MVDIRVELEGSKFDLRACGILEREGEILVSIEADGTHTLSGGAVKIGEKTEETVVREFLEETGLAVKVDSLVGVVENFFEWEHMPYQQVIFVYKVSLEVETNDVLECREKVNAKWLPIIEVQDLKPVVLNRLITSKEEVIRHVINQG